jgi:Mn-containing catalase
LNKVRRRAPRSQFGVVLADLRRNLAAEARSRPRANTP